MLMALVPTAFAASTPPDFSDGWIALTSADGGKILNGGNYYLDDDVTIELGIDFIGTVVLDLNGHVLNLDKTRYGGTIPLPVINVYNTDETSTDFTLQDSNPTAKHYFSKQTNGLWKWEPTVTEATEGYELVEGGVITGGTGAYMYSYETGGGIYVGKITDAPLNVNINGGNIIGCQATEGAGIYNDEGTVTMNGGNVIGCVAGENGGGIYSYGNFTMNGGSVKNCTAGEDGGGMRVSGYRYIFTMNGGKIENCVATKRGGGVYNEFSKFKMTGGSIKNCTATNNPNTNAYTTYSGFLYANGGVIDGTVSYDYPSGIMRSDDAGGTTVFNGKVSYGDKVKAGIFYGELESISTFYGKLIGNTYTVKFFENDTDTEPFATAFIVGDGTILVPPTAPEKTDYTFDAWYTENGSEYTFDSAVASDFSLYAEYTHTDHADSDGDGLCDTCGEEVPVTTPTEPTTEKTLADYIIAVVYEALMALVKIIVNVVKSYI